MSSTELRASVRAIHTAIAHADEARFEAVSDALSRAESHLQAHLQATGAPPHQRQVRLLRQALDAGNRAVTGRLGPQQRTQLVRAFRRAAERVEVRA